jgi:tetratricopeptide (TPR) repeat protein
LARTYSREGDLAQAGIHYGEIVSSGNLLEEVIDALETVADAAPDHLPTHELLADAYMRDGRLQKALDKYRWLRERLAD